MGYYNLWDIFRFIFRQLRQFLHNFFHKIIVAENFFFFLEMHNTILQRLK